MVSGQLKRLVIWCTWVSMNTPKWGKSEQALGLLTACVASAIRRGDLNVLTVSYRYLGFLLEHVLMYFLSIFFFFFSFPFQFSSFFLTLLPYFFFSLKESLAPCMLDVESRGISLF